MVGKIASLPLSAPVRKRPRPLPPPALSLEQEVLALLRDLDRKVEAVIEKLEHR